MAVSPVTTFRDHTGTTPEMEFYDVGSPVVMREEQLGGGASVASISTCE
jgi:hypothetical protein